MLTILSDGGGIKNGANIIDGTCQVRIQCAIKINFYYGRIKEIVLKIKNK